MATTSTYPAVMDAMVAALKALPALAGVDVFSAPAGDSAQALDVVEFGQMEMDDNPHTMAGNRLEEYTVEGTVGNITPGSGEAAIKVSRDRAFGILAAIETYLNDDNTISGACADADLDTVGVEYGYTPSGRGTFIEFKVVVRAAKNP